MSNDPNNTNAVAVVTPSKPMFVVPVRTVNELETIGAKYASSGFFGQISPSQGFLVAQSQREERLTVTEWIRRHQVIGNTISTRPNWMLGEFKRRGGKVHIVRADRDVCEIGFTHWDGETLVGKITMDDMRKTTVPFAKDGKTLKTNWQNFPDDMLFARVCGKTLRRLCPEVFCGMYTDGEARDFDEPSAPAQVQAVASPSPISAPSESIDYAVCPCGTVRGKRWNELAIDKLEKILATPEDKAKALTPEHRKAIVAELARREEEMNTSSEEFEAEVVDVE